MHIFNLLFLYIGISASFYQPFIQRKSTVVLYESPRSSIHKKYPFSPKYYEKYIRRLQNETLYGNFTRRGIPILYLLQRKMNAGDEDDGEEENMPKFDRNGDNYDEDEEYNRRAKLIKDLQLSTPSLSNNRIIRSENFEVLTTHELNFTSVGGYDIVKEELYQCLDILQNASKYAKYNVRIPKGIILEGPPGNGKTMIAKAFAGEANANFIAVSGAEFVDKYVGVGSSRIRELFKLARDNIPCIIFIDEIDAVGRKRSSGDASASERDNTLNELLVQIDGFKTTPGILIIGATNRIDLLDTALLRDGRIDKKIYVNMPDEKTRTAILEIHLRGKPHADNINIEDLVEQTSGFSGAQIENLLNEAMLRTLRNNRDKFTQPDIEYVLQKMSMGWQPSDHELSDELVMQIAIHEMGHAVVGMLARHYANVSKVVINLSSPRTPGVTVFDVKSDMSLLPSRNSLYEYLMITLGGHIAELTFYGGMVTTGASHDIDQIKKLAEDWVLKYGMGDHIIYPVMSEEYRRLVDEEISYLIQNAEWATMAVIHECHDLIADCAEQLVEHKVLKADTLYDTLFSSKYHDLYEVCEEYYKAPIQRSVHKEDGRYFETY